MPRMSAGKRKCDEAGMQIRKIPGRELNPNSSLSAALNDAKLCYIHL